MPRIFKKPFTTLFAPALPVSRNGGSCRATSSISRLPSRSCSEINATARPACSASESTGTGAAKSSRKSPDCTAAATFSAAISAETDVLRIRFSRHLSHSTIWSAVASTLRVRAESDETARSRATDIAVFSGERFIRYRLQVSTVPRTVTACCVCVSRPSISSPNFSASLSPVRRPIKR